MGYDAYESVTEARDAHRHVYMSYTPLGSLASRVEDGKEVRFRYDRMERLVDVVNERGDTYSFIRDAAGQVHTERGFDGMTRKYTRNRAGETIRGDGYVPYRTMTGQERNTLTTSLVI